MFQAGQDGNCRNDLASSIEILMAEKGPGDKLALEHQVLELRRDPPSALPTSICSQDLASASFSIDSNFQHDKNRGSTCRRLCGARLSRSAHLRAVKKTI
jgi:hypothetical protein